jgi:uncharacterized repeat protein (TIGR03803 family)
MLLFKGRLLCLFLPLVLLLAIQSRPAAAAEYKVVHQFCSEGADCLDGAVPGAALVRDAKGNLYGTTESGGAFGAGTVFRLQPKRDGKWKFDVLHDFCAQAFCIDGVLPTGSVIIDRDGNLYGVTGADLRTEASDSLVYRLHPDGDHWNYEILYEFCPGQVCDGTFAQAGLAYAGQASGKPYDGTSPLFGVAGAGGAHDSGVAFMLVPTRGGQWQHADLYDFCAQAGCVDGDGPSQPLVVEDARHVVGVTAGGGQGRSGVVFRLSSEDGVSWTESVVHAFCTLEDCADGGSSISSLARDGAGNLFGTTLAGGKCLGLFACGTIFEITPDGTETVLFGFCREVGGCKVGSEPGAGVTLAPDGTLYGTTVAGGEGQGDAYAFDGHMKRLHSFCDCGGNVRAPMIIDPQGHLFGVTGNGEANGGGVVFEITP